MKLHVPHELDEVTGLCCRQAPLRGAIGGLIVCGALAGAAFLWWYLRAPWFVWGGIGLLAALITPFVCRDAIAKFRATNWVLMVRPDGLWINLRSYQNPHLPAAATALHLHYEDVARAHRHIETWSTPGTRGGSTTSTQWKQESLELHLASGDTGEIARALTEERRRKAPVHGALRIAVKGTQQSVTVPGEGIIRIAWRGAGHDVSPTLTKVLTEFAHRVEVIDTTRMERGDWRKMSDQELNELLAHLVRAGDKLAAADLLVRRRGCSATQAHQLVEELDATF